LLGANATETAFKAEPLADFEIIHIAAHGITSAKFPDRAALVLGNDPKSGEDGLLQVREIRDLNLAADLVTLSACDTGVGALEGEEGIANLVRAIARIFSPANHRRITWSISIILTSRYAIFSPPSADWLAYRLAQINRIEGGWANDPENVG